MHFRIFSAVLASALFVVGCTPHPDDSITGPGASLAIEGEPSSGVPAFASVSRGPAHTCALTAAGEAYCWGSNQAGFLGDGTTTDRLVPTPVSGGHAFVAISVGNGHTCALEADGDAFCWGSNSDGMLGDGTTTDSSVPVAVTGGHAFTSIHALELESCGLEADGDLHCWGSNRIGVSNPDYPDFTVPAPVASPFAFASVAVGVSHTCGLDAAGSAYCWGFNNAGQIGDGTTITRSEPVPVVGGQAFVSLHAGNSHTCGLEADGELHCWGSNRGGAIGNGGGSATAPTAVSGGQLFASVELGGNHSCAINVDGDAYCWGLNNFGQIGDGTLTNRNVPTLVSGGHDFTSINAGGIGSCALEGDGDLFCWGANFLGQIGDGTTLERLVPTAVGSTSTDPVPAHSVTDLEVESATTSSLTLYWTQVDGGLGDPAWYRVKYAEPPLDDWRNATIGCNASIEGDAIGAEIFCTVRDLEPDTEYEIQLMSHRVVDTKWEGAVYSNVAVGTTFTADVATTVQDLDVTAATASTLTLTWTQVNDGRGEPAWYRVKYGSPLVRWREGQIGCDRTIRGTEIGASMTCTIDGLQSATTYDVQLYSYYLRDGKWAAAHRSNLASGTTAPGG